MYITKFGGLDLPTIQYNMSESQGASKTIPVSQVDSSVIRLGGDGTSPYGEDTINKRFLVESDTPANLQAAVDELVNELMLSQEDFREGVQLLIATLNDGTKRATFAECQEARWNLEYFNYQNAWLGPVDITWKRTTTKWFTYADLLYLGDHQTFASVDADAATYGQAVFEATVNDAIEEFTITNNGKQRVTDGIIELDAAITNPTILNLRNKYTFTWTGDLIAGERFTLNIATLIAKKDGVLGEWPNIEVGTDRGQLAPMVLEPGDNLFRVTSTGPDCTFRFYYAREWL